MNNISFVSNRRLDTLFMEHDPENNTTTAFAVFVYDYSGKDHGYRKYSEGNYINHTQPLSPGRNEFFYLSDKNGIVNRYYAKYDSTISLVDTTIHYRYFANSFPFPTTNETSFPTISIRKQMKLRKLSTTIAGITCTNTPWNLNGNTGMSLNPPNTGTGM